MTMDVGFIGLGGMGRAMAGRILDAGHMLRVWNRSAAAGDELVAKGATRATTPAEAFGAKVVLSMLADDTAVRDTVLGGGLDGAGPGTIHVNMATISAALARELADAHRTRGVGYVSAPVFGRPEAAAAGSLHIVAAGDPASIERVMPVLQAIGQRVWPMGDDPVRATVVKIAGNFLLAAAIESMAEASALVAGFGVAPKEMLEVMTNTLFSAPAYKNYGAMIAARTYEPAGFRLVLGLKDVRLALDAGGSATTPLPFASVLRDNFLDAIAQGQGDLDWSALAEVAFRRAGRADVR